MLWSSETSPLRSACRCIGEVLIVYCRNTLQEADIMNSPLINVFFFDAQIQHLTV